MAMKMFRPNPDRKPTRGDRIRGLIALALTIIGFAGGYSADNVQWQVFFMIIGFLSLFTTIGIVFKEADY